MAGAGAVQRGATQATYGLADDIRNSAAASISKAKDGLGFVGQTAVDVGATLTEMGLDKAKSTFLIGGLGPSYKSDEVLKRLADTLKLAPLAARAYGNNSQAARQNGADLKGATRYGVTTAITDAMVEKAFDGLNGLYGESAAKKLAKKFKIEINSDSFRSKLAMATVNDALEGVAEIIATDVADQMLKSVYNGQSMRDNFAETEWGRVGRNMLINTIVGILLGDKALA